MTTILVSDSEGERERGEERFRERRDRGRERERKGGENDVDDQREILVLFLFYLMRFHDLKKERRKDGEKIYELPSPSFYSLSSSFLFRPVCCT